MILLKVFVISLLYGYTKPKIKSESEISFIDCKDLRHPIIERLNTDINYVSNDVMWGDDVNGILLFGTNLLVKVV